MGHDYTKLMSAALDGRLDPREQVEWQAHLADCPHCQQRWSTLHDIDRMFRKAALAAPSPGFTARFSKRLARQQAIRHSQQRTLAGAAVLALGALAILVIVGWLMAWQLPGLSGMLAEAPTYIGNLLQALAQWLVLFRALSETGQALAGLVLPWVAGLALIYVGLLSMTLSSIVWQVTRRWSPAPVTAR